MAVEINNLIERAAILDDTQSTKKPVQKAPHVESNRRQVKINAAGSTCRMPQNVHGKRSGKARTLVKPDVRTQLLSKPPPKRMQETMQKKVQKPQDEVSMAAESALEKIELRKIVGGRPEGEPFVIPLNPTGMKDLQEVAFRDSSAMGSTDAEREFSNSPPGKIDLKFVLDGTAALTPPNEPLPEMMSRVAHIREITQKYDGDIHEPPRVEVRWGGFSIRGIDQSLTQPEEQREKNNSSPDLTHLVRIQAGDILLPPVVRTPE